MTTEVATTMQLYLIRHGETEWTVSHRHTGSTDIALSSLGEAQARNLEPRLRNLALSHVLTSPRQRARQTCMLAGLGASARVDADLTEWDYGDYEGRSSIDIQKSHPDWNLFRDGCPNGESPAQLSNRVDRLIQRLRGFDGKVAIFSHGQLSCALAARWIGLPVIDAQHFMLETASVSVLGFNPHHPKVPVIVSWNDVDVGQRGVSK